ncbi:MAG: ABC transporter substrate-binding protein [Eubacteriales bacterium]|nr:ABC transporter substrate-binding protein [Eubacteriales bacterium]
MKKIILSIALVLLSLFCFSCTNNNKNSVLKIYNAGEYIDPEVIEDFKKEYNIEVIYDVFETNEEMYPIVEIGSVKYDVVCPSDYMIQKMIQNNLLKEIDTNKLTNYENIKKSSLEISKQFDENNNYSIPYMEGTVGILCNNTLLKEKNLPLPTSWKDLWKEEYKDEILMQNSVRDAFLVALKKNGYSLNSTNKQEIDKATNELITQKPLVQAYVVDQVRDKMIGGEALIGVIYSGELLYILDEANGEYDYSYILPKEGTNTWIDSWVITKDAQNIDNAYLWLDFLLREDISKRNAEYITYDTTNEKAQNLLNDLYDRKNKITKDYTNNNNEVFKYLGVDTENYYNDSWKKIKSN